MAFQPREPGSEPLRSDGRISGLRGERCPVHPHATLNTSEWPGAGVPRAASEDSGSVNGRCVTPRRPPTPRRRRTHQPSHHTRTARWPAGTLRPAAPTSPCPFRIIAPQAPVRPGRSRGSQDSGPAPGLARAHAGLTRLPQPIASATPGPAPGRAPPPMANIGGQWCA